MSIMAGVLVCLITSYAGANEFDTRAAIQLQPAQQAHVLMEMRAMLSGVQGITAALAVDDMSAVASQARALGMSMKKQPEKTLHEALPPEFVVLGQSVHRNFDAIADDAQTFKDSRRTLRQLSETLGRCQGCHESYRIVSMPAMPDKHHLE